MIVPINYFASCNGQTTKLLHKIQELYNEGVTDITIKELEKTYPNTSDAQLALLHDLSLYLEKFHGCSETIQTSQQKEISNKSWMSTMLLCLFCGGFGVHRFYVGKIGTGVLQLLTIGGLGIWVTIDFIFICCQIFKDRHGKVVVIKNS